VCHQVRCYHDAGCATVIVVVGGAYETVVVQALGSTPGVVVVRNPDPSRGMLSSLREGVQSGLEMGAKRVAFGPVDLPIADSVPIREVLRAGRDTGYVVATYEAQRGHPALLSKGVAEAVCAASASASARQLLSRFACLEVPVTDPGVCGNLNTPAELASWRDVQEGRI